MSLDESQKYTGGLIIIGIGIVTISIIVYLITKANRAQKIMLIAEGIITLWALATVASYFLLRGVGGTL